MKVHYYICVTLSLTTHSISGKKKSKEKKKKTHSTDKLYFIFVIGKENKISAQHFLTHTLTSNTAINIYIAQRKLHFKKKKIKKFQFSKHCYNQNGQKVLEKN